MQHVPGIMHDTPYTTRPTRYSTHTHLTVYRIPYHYRCHYCNYTYIDNKQHTVTTTTATRTTTTSN